MDDGGGGGEGINCAAPLLVPEESVDNVEDAAEEIMVGEVGEDAEPAAAAVVDATGGEEVCCWQTVLGTGHIVVLGNY